MPLVDWPSLPAYDPDKEDEVEDLREKGTVITGLMTWSIGWDQSDNWKWSTAVSQLVV